MSTAGLSQAELKLAVIIWENSPIISSALIKEAEEAFGWKRTTTYTLLKRMADKGVVKNENAVITAVISKDEFFAEKSRFFVEESFGGSLPMFIASFFKGRKLTPEQADELRQLINDYEGSGDNV